MKNAFIELDAQTKLEIHFLFFTKDLFLDKSLEKDINLKNYFPIDNKRPVLNLNDSSKKVMIIM